MHTELTNLAPRESRMAFRHDYFLRLATVGTLLLSAVLVVNAFIMFPSYLYAREQVRSESANLEHLTKSADEKSAQNELASLQSEATYLSHLSATPTASALLQAILAVPRPGIILNGFTFTAPTPSSSSGTLEVSGIASTREALRSYDEALSSLPFVTSANLPISDYASDSDIAFTVTLTGSLNP